MSRKPCLGCGVPVEGPRCMDCAAETKRGRPDLRRRSTTARGYDGTWKSLASRARRLQPFCSDCGREDNLTTDHLPSAWDRHAQGLPITLADVDVVCSACNTDRGSSRPGSPRFETWVRAGRRRGDGVDGRLLDPASQGAETVEIGTIS